MVRHPVTEGVSSPPIGSTLAVQMKRDPPIAARVRVQREPDMLLVQELAGVPVTGSSADLRMRQTKTQSTCSKGPGAIRPATTSTLLDVPTSRWTNGQDPGMGVKNSTPFRQSLSPCSP